MWRKQFHMQVTFQPIDPLKWFQDQIRPIWVQFQSIFGHDSKSKYQHNGIKAFITFETQHKKVHFGKSDKSDKKNPKEQPLLCFQALIETNKKFKTELRYANWSQEKQAFAEDPSMIWDFKAGEDQPSTITSSIWWMCHEVQGSISISSVSYLHFIIHI